MEIPGLTVLWISTVNLSPTCISWTARTDDPAGLPRLTEEAVLEIKPRAIFQTDSPATHLSTREASLQIQNEERKSAVGVALAADPGRERDLQISLHRQSLLFHLLRGYQIRTYRSLIIKKTIAAPQFLLWYLLRLLPTREQIVHLNLGETVKDLRQLELDPLHLSG